MKSERNNPWFKPWFKIRSMFIVVLGIYNFVLDMKTQQHKWCIYFCVFFYESRNCFNKTSYCCKNSCRWCTKSSLEKLEKSNLENKSISRFFDDYIFLSADKLMSRFSGKRLIGWIGLIVNAHIRNRVDCSIFISKWFFYRNNGMKLFLMPCPFTGPKIFCAGPNFLSQHKNLFTYCASHKHFVQDKKMICIQ